MALSTSERAAYGYKGRAAGLTKSINTGAIERGLTEQQRRVESDAAIERDFAKTLGDLYDYDLIKPLGEDLMNDVNTLQQKYIDGEITMNEAYMDINNIKKKGKEYEYNSSLYKAAADPESGEYIIHPVTGEYLTGAKKFKYLADYMAMGGDKAREVADNSLRLDVRKAPEKAPQEIVMEMAGTFFDQYGQDGTLSANDINKIKTLNSTQDIYSFLQRKGIKGDKMAEQFKMAVKSNPSFIDASNYAFNTSDYVKGNFEGVEDFADEMIGSLYKDEETTEDIKTVKNLAAEEAIKKKYREEEEEKPPVYVESEITAETPETEGVKVNWGKTIIKSIFPQSAVPSIVFYDNKEVDADAFERELSEWSGGEKIKVVTIPESERGKERILTQDAYGQPQQYMINSNGDVKVVGAKSFKSSDDDYRGNVEQVISTLSPSLVKSLMANTEGLNLNYFEQEEQSKEPQTEYTVGYEEDGYRFKGGDPTDANNWEEI